MINSQQKKSFLGVVFDVDHDFEGPRAPKAHLDTVNRNLLDHLRRPFISDAPSTVAAHQGLEAFLPSVGVCASGVGANKKIAMT